MGPYLTVMNEHYTLGKTEIPVTPIGLGCWQFSRSQGLAGKYWPAIPQETVKEIVSATLEGGINWFDTAEVYGGGASEQSLSQALNELAVPRESYLIADKWFPAFRSARSVGKTFPAREKAMQGISIDLHQIHQPFSFSSVEKQIVAMGTLVREGKIRAVGVSNFNEKLTRRAHRRLSEYGLDLATNQMRYSLLDREIERNGVLDAAKELGITIIAYSPLSQGILTGRFHGANGEDIRQRHGPRKWMRRFKPEGLAATSELIAQLQDVAAAHDATAAQVALAWTVQRHGTTIVAIPGASSVNQAASNAAALGISLTAEQIQRLDDAGAEAERRLKKLG